MSIWLDLGIDFRYGYKSLPDPEAKIANTLYSQKSFPVPYQQAKITLKKFDLGSTPKA